MNYENTTIPSTKRIESALLSALIQEPTFIPMVTERIKAEMFEDKTNSKVWETICRKNQDGGAIDLASLCTELGYDAIKGFINPSIASPSMKTIADYAHNFINAYVHKQVYQCGWKMMQSAVNPTTSISELMMIPRPFEDDINNTIGMGDGEQNIGEVWEDLQTELMEDAISPSKVGTGFAKLDRLFNGGFRKGSLNIISARPSVGKTAFMLQMAKNASVNKQALVICMEMMSRELLKRILCSTGEVDTYSMEGEQSSAERTTRAFEQVKDLNLVFAEGGKTLEQVITCITRNHNQGHCDIAFIDYLGLIGGQGREQLSQWLGMVTRRLKLLAIDLHIPIVLLCQLNREADKENRPPELRDLRDSGSIEQDADVVLMLEKRQDEQGQQEWNEDCVRMWIRKHRQGMRNCYIDFLARNGYTLFIECQKSTSNRR